MIVNSQGPVIPAVPAYKAATASLLTWGSYVLAFSEKEKEHLEMLYQRGLNNGVPEMEIIDAAEIQKKEPHVSKEAVQLCMQVRAGITGPWELTIKLVENAMEMVLN